MRAPEAIKLRQTAEVAYLRLLLGVIDQQLDNLKKPGTIISFREYNSLSKEKAALTALIASASIEVDGKAYKQKQAAIPSRPALRVVK